MSVCPHCNRPIYQVNPFPCIIAHIDCARVIVWNGEDWIPATAAEIALHRDNEDLAARMDRLERLFGLGVVQNAT